MNWIDIIIAIPIVLALIRGGRKGFVMEATSLVALFLGLYAGLNGSGYAAERLHKEFKVSAEFLDITAFIVTFIAVVIIVHLIGKTVEKLVDMTALSGMDRVAGVVFAAARAILYWGVILILVRSTVGTDWIPKDQIRDSVLWPFLETSARAVLPIIESLNLGKVF
ncbi:MAG: CvpA family protein [Flavobacteriales bacterium]|jgi:membrane protein required for colicin V production|nr:CvpA family protein [Flavobacteriales bacterium]